MCAPPVGLVVPHTAVSRRRRAVLTIFETSYSEPHLLFYLLLAPGKLVVATSRLLHASPYDRGCDEPHKLNMGWDAFFFELTLPDPPSRKKRDMGEIRPRALLSIFKTLRLHQHVDHSTRSPSERCRRASRSQYSPDGSLHKPCPHGVEWGLTPRRPSPARGCG